MSAVADMREVYRGDYRQREASLPGSAVPWVRALRRGALDRFMEAGFPTVKNEDWKYTDVRALIMRRFTPVTAPGRVEPGALIRFGIAGPLLVFVDGHYVPALSEPGPLSGGVRVTNLAQVLADQMHDIEPWLGRSAARAQDGFGALNTALMEDGAFIHIGRGVAVETPIQLLFVATGMADSATHLRNVIVAEAGSHATVIETYMTVPGMTSAPGAYLTNAVTEVSVDPAAVLEHYRLEQETDAAYHVGVTDVHAARDSRYASHSVTVGGRIARHALTCILEGEGAECALNGLYVGSGRQHMDHHTRIEHLVARGTSREWYKGVLDGHARGVFSGRVVVHPQAQHTDAGQSNHNLLLSENAEADSRPQFEIYADDVKCAHGATTGSLDADALFYLRTRGLDEAHARRLLVYAFAGDVLARMGVTPVRQALERRFISQWMHEEPAGELVT